MLQQSKLIRSRNEWKNKAVQRATEIRELKKTRRRLKEKVAELKTLNSTIEPAADKKNQ